MAPSSEKPEKEKIPVHPRLDEIQARIDLFWAEKTAVVRGWMEKSLGPQVRKTKEQLDAEDKEFFNVGPPGLGLGFPIPKDYVDGDLRRKDIASNGDLRNLLMGKKAGLQASKPREDKDTNAKKRRVEESSDEEEGRSGLGKKKKVKRAANEVLKSVTVPLAHGKSASSKPAPKQRRESTSSSEDEESRSKTLSKQSKNIPPTASVTNQIIAQLASCNPPTKSTSTTDLPIRTTPTELADNKQAEPKVFDEAEARRIKNRLKKAKKKERKAREKALAAASSQGTNAGCL
jgi:hypothetical protein